MRTKSLCAALAALLPLAAVSQVPGSTEPSAPPLVTAPADSTPPPTPSEATPAPPATTPLPAGTRPGQPFSPQQEQPPLEIGLMVSEAAFGMLTAAGVSMLPYLLLNQSGFFSQQSSISNLMLVLIFSAVPLTVSQTQISLANGSRFYFSESWPASLSGLAAQAAVLALFYYGFGGPRLSAPNPGETFLLVGTVAFVPLVELAVINLTKTPRQKLPPGGFAPPAMVRFDSTRGLRLGAPAALPLLAGSSVGLYVPLVSAAL